MVMEEGLSPSITKKLLIVTLVLIGVVLLVGEEDDPGLLTETAQTAEVSADNDSEFGAAYGSDGSVDFPAELSEDEYVIEEYEEDLAETSNPAEGELQPDAASSEEEEVLMDDTQGFDPVPMMEVEPAY